MTPLFVGALCTKNAIPPLCLEQENINSYLVVQCESQVRNALHTSRKNAQSCYQTVTSSFRFELPAAKVVCEYQASVSIAKNVAQMAS